MSNNLPDVELFEVDADEPADDAQQHFGETLELIVPDAPKRNEIPTDLPADNSDFTDIDKLPGRLDEDPDAPH
jgi:hypothetical protein